MSDAEHRADSSPTASNTGSRCGRCGTAISPAAETCPACGALLAAYRPPAGATQPAKPISPPATTHPATAPAPEPQPDESPTARPIAASPIGEALARSERTSEIATTPDDPGALGQRIDAEVVAEIGESTVAVGDGAPDFTATATTGASPATTPASSAARAADTRRERSNSTPTRANRPLAPVLPRAQSAPVTASPVTITRGRINRMSPQLLALTGIACFIFGCVLTLIVASVSSALASFLFMLASAGTAICFVLAGLRAANRRTGPRRRR